MLARAFGYPYASPAGSFVFDVGAGEARPLPSGGSVAALVEGRTAVLAVGSNSAPEQLSRKFAGLAGEIPVLRTFVRDVDVVFAARVASYGSVPATLASSPGTVVSVFTTFLDREQLEVMHTSESVGIAYDVEEVPVESVSIEGLGDASFGMASGAPYSVDRVLAYAARSGLLEVSGSPVALAAVRAEGRRFPAWSQREVLASVAERWGWEAEELVRSVVAEAEVRRRVNEELAARAIPARSR